MRRVSVVSVPRCFLYALVGVWGSRGASGSAGKIRMPNWSPRSRSLARLSSSDPATRIRSYEVALLEKSHVASSEPSGWVRSR